MSVEIGGNNGIQPLMAAAHLGRPVVDADAIGWAYPEAQMTSFAVADLKPYPLSLVDPRGVEGIGAKVPGWTWMERLSRKMCVEVGSIAATCKAPRIGAEVKAWGIPDTPTQAIRLAQREHRDPIQVNLDAEDGRLIFRGKLADHARRLRSAVLARRCIPRRKHSWSARQERSSPSGAQ